MSSRTVALALTVLGAGLLYLVAADAAAFAPGLLGTLLAIAAIWLAAGRTRLVLAGLSAVAWAGALVLAVGSLPALAAAVTGLSGAVVTLARGPHWPGWSSKYSRSAEEEEVTPRQMWESLDRGEDPTRSAD